MSISEQDFNVNIQTAKENAEVNGDIVYYFYAEKSNGSKLLHLEPSVC
jgi:hypothetical protein